MIYNINNSLVCIYCKFDKYIGISFNINLKLI